VNGRGVISLETTIDAVVSIDMCNFQNIRISSSTNGAVSIEGLINTLFINGSVFNSIYTGNNGGGLYLSISSYGGDSENTCINNSLFRNCTAINGGGIYIASVGVALLNLLFTNNIASSAGHDIYENNTQSETYYNSVTVQQCCSSLLPMQNYFALADGSTLNHLLCNKTIGERYVRSSNTYDLQNTCLNQNSPCRTISWAIQESQRVGEDNIFITILDEDDFFPIVISVGVVVHLHSPSDTSIGLFSYFFFCHCVFVRWCEICDGDLFRDGYVDSSWWRGGSS
jgi:hypothetical protein